MKMRKLFKQTMMCSVAILTSVGIVGCGSGVGASANKKETAQTASAMEKEVLVVGVDDTFAPMGFKDESGEMVGLDVDLAKAMGEKLGKTVQFQTIDWSMKETELNAGNIDLIWNGYTITEERKAQVAFGTPYLKNKQVIITLADSDIRSKADLKDKTVAAQTGSSAVDAIEAEPDVLASFKDGKPVTYESNNDVLMDLESGRVDAAVADEVIVRYYISKKGEEKFRILEENFGDEEYGVGMRKEDTALVEAFNKAYAELKAEGKLAEISNKWFGEDITC